MTNFADKLIAVAPLAAPHASALEAACAEFDIAAGRRAQMFLATCAHESGSFRYVRELWGPTDQQRKYEPPSKLAKALGNTQIGDGRRFAGRGWIQVTGRDNARRCSLALFGDDRLVQDPRWLESPEGAARSAGWFWSTNKLNALADAGDFIGTQGAVNVGNKKATTTQIIGFPDRRRWFEKMVAAGL